MNKKVLILSGGISKERLISLDTGFQVAKELKKNGYKVKVCEPDKNLTKSIKIFKPSIIGKAENLSGATGIMMDDWLSGILSALILFVLYLFGL